jgi:DNA-binding NtrC family response regulator
VDVRILAATSRTALSTTPEAVGLRQDLAARLGAEPIRLPPLRERREDLGSLIAHFLGTPAKPFDLAAFQALCLHHWPGNVRELQKVISTAEALGRTSERFGFEQLPQALAVSSGKLRLAPTGRADRRAAPTAVELEDLIRQSDGNMMKVARDLDRKPAVVYRWAKRFHLNIEAYRKKDS